MMIWKERKRTENGWKDLGIGTSSDLEEKKMGGGGFYPYYLN